MKNYLENLKIVKDVTSSNKIELEFYDSPEDHYFIDAEIEYCGKKYYISTGFFSGGFDCSVEIDEFNEEHNKIMRCSYIEIENYLDLREALDLALNKIITDEK